MCGSIVTDRRSKERSSREQQQAPCGRRVTKMKTKIADVDPSHDPEDGTDTWTEEWWTPPEDAYEPPQLRRVAAVVVREAGEGRE